MPVINNLPQNLSDISVTFEGCPARATKMTHTFTDDYDLVIITFAERDTDNNGDNFMKVFDTDKGSMSNGTGASTTRNTITDMWTPFVPNGGTVAGTTFANSIDTNTHLVSITGNAGVFASACYKKHVKKDDIIYLYASHAYVIPFIFGIKYSKNIAY